MVPEVLRKEEMAVLLIVCDVDFKRRELYSALRADALRGSLLLGEHRLQLELAKLHVGTQSEQVGSTTDKRVV